jgi:GT2 family glycosyltransferase
MQTSRRVSVVIPTNREHALLMPAVESFRADPAVLEVIVVDDHEAVQSARDELDPLVRVVRSGGRGPAVARDIGAACARGEVVLFLDDDVRPGSHLASAHAARHLADNLVVVGYMPVPETRRDTVGSLPGALYRQEYERRVAAYEREPAAVLRNLWGGNISLRRETVASVGWYNPRFQGRRHEDRDFGLRCLRANLSGIFDRRLEASHNYQRTLREFLDDASAQGAELVQLHDLYPDLLGAFEQEIGWRDLPTGMRALVRACDSPLIERLVIRMIVASLLAIPASARLSLRLSLLRLGRRVKRHAGASAQLRRLAVASHGSP